MKKTMIKTFYINEARKAEGNLYIKWLLEKEKRGKLLEQNQEHRKLC